MNEKRKDRVKKQLLKRREALRLSRKAEKDKERTEWKSRERKAPHRNGPIQVESNKLEKNPTINREQLLCNYQELKTMLSDYDMEVEFKKNNVDKFDEFKSQGY